MSDNTYPQWHSRSSPDVIDYLEAGDSLNDFLEDFPSVTREQAVAALEQRSALSPKHVTPGRLIGN